MIPIFKLVIKHRISLFSLGFFIACLSWTLINFSLGWDYPIGVGNHAFRQTHTALSAYYIAQNGPWFAYETPLLGPPWSIPFEFPLFQLLVAGLHKLTAYDLGQSGRVISILMFLICVFVSIPTLKFLHLRIASRLIVSALLLICPIYQYYSRCQPGRADARADSTR